MSRIRTAALALLLPACGLAAGCSAFHHPPPQPPPVVIVQPPLIFPVPPPEPMSAPFDLAPEDAPLSELAAVLPDDASYGPPPHREVPRPEIEPRPPVPEQPAPVEPTPPPLTAGLSPQQQVYFRRRATDTLQQANALLQRLQSRRLAPAAAATRDQANEYVRQAGQALALGDVVRAQTLADKAFTLARFLAAQ